MQASELAEGAEGLVARYEAFFKKTFDADGLQANMASLKMVEEPPGSPVRCRSAFAFFESLLRVAYQQQNTNLFRVVSSDDMPFFIIAEYHPEYHVLTESSCCWVRCAMSSSAF